MRRNYQPGPAAISMHSNEIKAREQRAVNSQVEAFFADDGAIVELPLSTPSKKQAGPFVINPAKAAGRCS